MKLSFKQPNETLYKQKLKALGVTDYTFGESMFPTIVKPEYYPLWEAYILTVSANELYMLGTTKAQGTYFAVLGFISHLQNIATGTLTKNLDVTKASLPSLDIWVKPINKSVEGFMKRHGLSGDLKVSRTLSKAVKPDYSPLIHSYVGFTLEKDYVLIPRSPTVMGITYNESKIRVQKESMSRILASLQGYLYTGSVPEELLGDKANFKDKSLYVYKGIHTTRQMPEYQWYRFNSKKTEGLTILIARAEQDVILLRVKAYIPAIIFGGTNSKQKLIKDMDKYLKYI